MAAAGKQCEAPASGRFVFRLGQDAPSAGDHGVSGEHMGGVGIDRQRFLTRDAPGIIARQFLFEGRLIDVCSDHGGRRSEEHTSELQSLMRISYAVFCLKKKKYE